MTAVAAGVFGTALVDWANPEIVISGAAAQPLTTKARSRAIGSRREKRLVGLVGRLDGRDFDFGNHLAHGGRKMGHAGDVEPLLVLPGSARLAGESNRSGLGVGRAAPH